MRAGIGTLAIYRSGCRACHRASSLNASLDSYVTNNYTAFAGILLSRTMTYGVGRDGNRESFELLDGLFLRVGWGVYSRWKDVTKEESRGFSLTPRPCPRFLTH